MTLIRQKVTIKRKAIAPTSGNTRADLIANIVASLAGITFASSLIINGFLLTVIDKQEEDKRFYSELANHYINKAIEHGDSFRYKGKYYKTCIASIPNPNEPGTLTLCEVKNESR